MVRLTEVKRGKKTYYYLDYSYRVGKKVHKRKNYLGTTKPKNIEDAKLEFLREIYSEKWYPKFDEIKKQHKKGLKTTPKSIKEKNLEDFIVRYVYNTQRIEGSKLTLRETADLLEEGISPKRKPMGDVWEADAHKEIFHDMLESKKEISFQRVLYWNKKLLEKSKPDIAGKYRNKDILITGSKFTPSMGVEVYPLLREFFKWYAKNKTKTNPVELALLAHLKFVTIHPFGDGDGRISRLMMNDVLNKSGYPLFNINYEDKNGYYNALERSQLRKEDYHLIHWGFKKYVKEYGKS